ncbi:hypothetical protein [Elizabethkingia anophelis]|uniref:hypothetical protein n=1 Tax=Elizabethkingia anophelis TaxID=1117645 RepID=UPI001316A84B|nr:hypothetical protein [Elizabethkingia anophelis]MDV3636696.1 hypothetical protein [Elizabethkingia anophelis]MDV3653213.1 hypothetical protein [Elizabethkingia anophelis]MDV3734283.1 hypothetical protein [Elizabethkingia anophelis]BBQ09300.1 hypothetical protein JUNP353_3871 [Elizabethkingia anophelis]
MKNILSFLLENEGTYSVDKFINVSGISRNELVLFFNEIRKLKPLWLKVVAETETGIGVFSLNYDFKEEIKKYISVN